MRTDAVQLRQEHDAALARVSARESIRYHARGVVVTFLALLLGGTAARLGHDGHGGATWAAVAASACLALGAVHLVLGRRAAAREAGDIARLLELRRELGFDPAGTTGPGAP